MVIVIFLTSFSRILSDKWNLLNVGLNYFTVIKNNDKIILSGIMKVNIGPYILTLCCIL
jgi:hypothetical protein